MSTYTYMHTYTYTFTCTSAARANGNAIDTDIACVIDMASAIARDWAIAMILICLLRSILLWS